jgi:hypothetical protein
MADPTIADGDLKTETRTKEPERESNSGRLTRDGMIQALKMGYSVFINTPSGTVQVTSEDQLPSEAEMAFASGDEAQTQSVIDLLTRKRAQLDADLQLLTGNAPVEGRIAPNPQASAPSPRRRAGKPQPQQQPQPPDDDDENENEKGPPKDGDTATVTI